jgi:hypothetical protein
MVTRVTRDRCLAALDEAFLEGIKQSFHEFVSEHAAHPTDQTAFDDGLGRFSMQLRKRIDCYVRAATAVERIIKS